MDQQPKPAGRFTRHDIRYTSGETECAAWLYMPDGVEKPPVVVMGHGLGAIREMRLDAFSERFAAAGFATLAFTYRYFGDSGGAPRQLLSVSRQLEDWDAAIAYVKSHPHLDRSRIAVWGSSFGGGHAITVASRHPELRATVSQCPFTDGFASAASLGFKGNLQAAPVLIKDLIARALGRDPVMVPIAARPGGKALMNAHDALDGYLQLMPKGMAFVNYVPARVMLDILRYRPGLAARKIKMPILFCVSNTDTVTPPGRTLTVAKRAPRGQVKRYDAGHFDFYKGETFEQLAHDQIAFLTQHLMGTTH